MSRRRSAPPTLSSITEVDWESDDSSSEAEQFVSFARQSWGKGSDSDSDTPERYLAKKRGIKVRRSESFGSDDSPPVSPNMKLQSKARTGSAVQSKSSTGSACSNSSNGKKIDLGPRVELRKNSAGSDTPQRDREKPKWQKATTESKEKKEANAKKFEPAPRVSEVYAKVRTESNSSASTSAPVEEFPPGFGPADVKGCAEEFAAAIKENGVEAAAEFLADFQKECPEFPVKIFLRELMQVSRKTANMVAVRWCLQKMKEKGIDWRGVSEVPRRSVTVGRHASV